jgi:hypothetical protein
MIAMTDKYQGIELFGTDGKRIGIVAGLLTGNDRRQHYVVETRGVLGRGKTRYYVPAEHGVATGGRRLDVDAREADFVAWGWHRPPASRADR